MPESNFAVDAVLAGSFADIAQNRGPIGDCLRLAPRAEAIAQRKHIGIGADAGVTEQVPRSAGRIARFQNYEALAGTFRLQMVGRADAG